MADRELTVLRTIAEGTAGATGEVLFCTLVEHMARAIGTRHAFVAEFMPPKRIRTLSFWSGGELAPNIEFELTGTPCEEVIDGKACFYPFGVEDRYPDTQRGIQSYLGAPLLSQDGRILGHLCVYDELPLPDDPRTLAIIKLFASRAASELVRIRLEQNLREKEAQLQDLFEEAPVAYVHEDMDWRFISANRAARSILGITAEEVTRTIGTSLVADRFEAKRPVRESLKRMGVEDNADGAILELRRKDNGKPIWVQWWSRPDPSGAYTRSMFVDITARVLMEQENARLNAQNVYLLEEIKSEHNFEEIIGNSPALLQLMEKVRRVAPTEASVLITGESGTGKELIARAIHAASARADKPFIKVSCAALPISLVESELFGHERGAFSGAIQRRIGRFELAHGGTIFLDEIGEVPTDVQVKLLRVLQEREFERIGGSDTVKTDVRVLAATNRNLRASIRDGDFRADLYYRLDVFPIELPPLRERLADLPLLAHFFVQTHAPRIGRHIEAIDMESMQRLIRYSWPGNIRELENVIERALILNGSKTLQIDADLLLGSEHFAASQNEPPPARSMAVSAKSVGDLDFIQREHILSVLEEVNWVIEGGRGAAVRLGLPSGTLRHRMKKLGIIRNANR